MKKILFILLIFACNHSDAQQKFIEVTVTDTVLAKPDFFVYSLTLADNEDNEFDNSRYKDYKAYNIKMDQQKKNQKRTFDSLVLDLRKKGYSFLVPPIADTFGIGSNSSGGFSTAILLHSFDSLSQLYQLLKKQKYVYGSLVIALAKDESVYQNRLYKKLLDAATVKAKNIATYSNQRISGIVSVTENKQGDGINGWTSYPPLSALRNIVPGWHTVLKESDQIIINDTGSINLYPIHASFIVRFSVE